MEKIKLPTSVLNILETLEENGYEAYVVGGCIRDNLLGMQPLDWDITTSANVYDVCNILKNAKIVSEEYHVARLDLAAENLYVDIATFRSDGKYLPNGKPEKIFLSDDISDDVRRRDFTVNAMAFNPKRPLLDFFDGRKDLKKGLIRTIGIAEKRFQEDPSRMLRAIRFSNKLGFKIEDTTLKAIGRKRQEIGRIGSALIREEFEKILLGERSGSGLRLMLTTGLLEEIIFGEGKRKFSLKERKKLKEFLKRIDRLKRDRYRIIALFFSCIEKNNRLKFLEQKGYSIKEKNIFYDISEELKGFDRLVKSEEIKAYIKDYGIDKYVFMQNLTRANNVIWPNISSKRRANQRNNMLLKILKNNDAVFISDLEINGQDLVRLGIPMGKNIGVILEKMIYIVHRCPEKNNVADLEKMAETIYKKLK